MILSGLLCDRCAFAIPRGMPRGGLEVAIDTHDEPFYGKTPELLTYTCKTRAKAGTTHFFRVASAYVIWREVRLTLALTYVLPEDDLPGVVERLLQRLGHLGLHAAVLYLDKGFCSGDILRDGRQVALPAAEANAEMTTNFQMILLMLYLQPILLLLDRAPWHFGAVTTLIEQTDRLQVVYFPPASPDLNPQEHVWERARDAISHNHTYRHFQPLIDAFETYLQ